MHVNTKARPAAAAAAATTPSTRRTGAASIPAIPTPSPPASTTTTTSSPDDTSTAHLDHRAIGTRARRLIVKESTAESTDATLSEEKEDTRAARKREVEDKKKITLTEEWSFWCTLSNKQDGYLAKEKGVYLSHNRETDEWKMGSIYSETDTPTNFGKRMITLYQASASESIYYKLLSTENKLSEEAVRDLENFGKFLLFLEPRGGDPDRSCFSCKAELYLGLGYQRGDAVVDALRRYALSKSGDIEYVTSNGRTVSSGNYEEHPLYYQYLYKAGLGARQKHYHDWCMWTPGNESGMGIEELYMHWRYFTSSFIASCPCMGGGFGGVENIGMSCYASAVLIVLLCQPEALLSPLEEIRDSFGSDAFPCIDALVELNTRIDPSELLNLLFTEEEDEVEVEEDNEEGEQRQETRFTLGQQQDATEFLSLLVEKVDRELAAAGIEHRFKESFGLCVAEHRCCRGLRQLDTFPLTVQIGNAGEEQVMDVEDCVNEYFQGDDQDCDVCSNGNVIISKRIMTR
jgi:hypothetical protein